MTEENSQFLITNYELKNVSQNRSTTKYIFQKKYSGIGFCVVYFCGCVCECKFGSRAKQ